MPREDPLRIRSCLAVDRDSDAKIRPGDQIIVMPVIDSKTLQNAIDIATIISRVAITAGIFVGI